MSILWLQSDVWQLVLPDVNNNYKGVLPLVCKYWLKILGNNYPLSMIEFIKMGRINLIKWSLDVYNCKNNYMLLYKAAEYGYPGIFKLLLENGAPFDEKIFIYLGSKKNIKGLNILIKNKIFPSKRTKQELEDIPETNKELLNWIKQIK